jgi:trans-aconitate 2-methyltransferase
MGVHVKQSSWSAAQYVAFEDERTRPVRDLLAALPPLEPRGALIDIGCGPGNSTELLGALLPQASLSGIDSSADMLEAARKRLPGVRFALESIERWVAAETGAFDVILANAVLHWLPGHETLFPALLSKLSERGALAVQMPDNLAEPAHVLMREVAATGPWASKLRAVDAQRAMIASVAQYHELLAPLCRRVDVWRTTYYHTLPDTAAIVEWFKGSGLRPFIAPLDEAERPEFVARYAAGVAKAYPRLRDGRVLLPFPRLFITAVK